jgi:hypothetical protein
VGGGEAIGSGNALTSFHQSRKISCCVLPHIGLSREERTQEERSLTQLNRFMLYSWALCAILSNIEEEEK